MEEFFPLPHILLSINVSSTFNLGHSYRDKMESQSFDLRFSNGEGCYPWTFFKCLSVILSSSAESF